MTGETGHRPMPIDVAATALLAIAWGPGAPEAADRRLAMREAAEEMGTAPRRPVAWLVARAALHGMAEPPDAAPDLADRLRDRSRELATVGVGDDAGLMAAAAGRLDALSTAIGLMRGPLSTAALVARAESAEAIAMAPSAEARIELEREAVAQLLETNATVMEGSGRRKWGDPAGDYRTLAKRIRARGKPETDYPIGIERERCAAHCEARAAYFDGAPGHRDWTDAARSLRATAEEIRMGRPGLGPTSVNQGRQA